MSRKAECPGCGSYTSSVQAVLDGEADACPHCGLSASAMLEVLGVQSSRADSELKAQCKAALLDADKWQQRALAAEERLRAVKSALDEEP